MQQENLHSTDSTLIDSSNTSGTTTSAVSPDGKKKITNENILIPPQQLVAFPPLAFLLNIILIGLNNLKDCPLLSLEPILLKHLHQFFVTICKFLQTHSTQINENGKKYLMNSLKEPTKSENQQNQQQFENSKMDSLYKHHVIEDVIQYSLICFHSIYSGK